MSDDCKMEYMPEGEYRYVCSCGWKGNGAVKQGLHQYYSRKRKDKENGNARN